MIPLADLAAQITALPGRGRKLVAVAGPPGGGKSTLADALIKTIGPTAQLVPMDGFHLDNAILDARGLRRRKGAPDTFDLGGLTRLVEALHREENVFYPIFRRDWDIAVAGGGDVTATHETVVIEGNYLMFDAPGWRNLVQHWDACLFIDVPRDELRARLLQRWRNAGLPEVEAQARVEENDLPNADAVLNARLAPNTEIRWP